MLEPAPGRVRLRLAGPGARPAARGRHRRRPGHPDRRAAGLVLPATPGRPAWSAAKGTCSAAVRGSRSAPAHRRTATRAAGITERLAQRYADHPALALWHAHNEYGGVNPACYCETSAEAFRGWLRDRYGDLDRRSTTPGAPASGASGTATGTEIEPPRARTDRGEPGAAAGLPALLLRRAPGLLPAPSATSCTAISPDVPVTTNFMVANCKWMDYWRWASRGGRGLQRPLPAGRTGGQPHRTGHGRRPDPVASPAGGRGC